MRLPRPSRGHVGEPLAGLDENGGIAPHGLIAPDDHVGIERVELNAAADAADLVRDDQRRARAEERIQDDVAAVGEVGGRSPLKAVVRAAAGGNAPRV